MKRRGLHFWKGSYGMNSSVKLQVSAKFWAFKFLQTFVAVLQKPLEVLICFQPHETFLKDLAKQPSYLASARNPHGAVPVVSIQNKKKNALSFFHLSTKLNFCVYVTGPTQAFLR